MNDSDYVVAFNILDSGYRNWWFPAFGLLLGAGALLIISLVERVKRKNVAFLKMWFIVFPLVWTFVTFIGTFVDYSTCSHALASGKASYVEGTVDNFVPMPRNGHGLESFTVGGVNFSYSDFVVQAGFNTSTFKGGPIRQGLPVHIWYVGKEIVKLEIKK